MIRLASAMNGSVYEAPDTFAGKLLSVQSHPGQHLGTLCCIESAWHETDKQCTDFIEIQHYNHVFREVIELKICTN